MSNGRFINTLKLSEKLTTSMNKINRDIYTIFMCTCTYILRPTKRTTLVIAHNYVTLMILFFSILAITQGSTYVTSELYTWTQVLVQTWSLVWCLCKVGTGSLPVSLCHFLCNDSFRARVGDCWFVKHLSRYRFDTSVLCGWFTDLVSNITRLLRMSWLVGLPIIFMEIA